MPWAPLLLIGLMLPSGPLLDEDGAPKIEKLLAASREALAEREARVLAMLPPAIEGLNHPPSSGEARLAADSVRQLGAAVIPHLLPYLEPPDGAGPFLATNVANLIGELATPSILPELLSRIQGKNLTIAHNALVALSPHATPAHSEAIASLLERKAANTQTLALEVLTRIGDPRITPKVIPLLESERNELRGAAVQALIAFEDEKGIEALRERIVKEDHALIFEGLATFFADRNEPKLPPQVLARARNRLLSSNHRIKMIQLLAQMKYENAVQPLEVLASSEGENFGVREEAAYAAYQMGSTTGAKAILDRWEEAIRDRPTSWQNWRGIARVYKNLGKEKSAIDSLTKAIKYKTVRTRDADVSDLGLEMARCYSRMEKTRESYLCFKKYKIPLTDEVMNDPELAKLRETKHWEDLIRYR